MEKNKVTVKDIAKEAGVSTATVSYVLNYSEKQKISQSTRLKVFEAAKRLQYVPDMAAKSLANQRSFLVGIMVGAQDNSALAGGNLTLICRLHEKLSELGYDCIFLTDESVGAVQKRSLEAVFLIDFGYHQLKKLVAKLYVPAIIIDGKISDSLYHEVVGDYDSIFRGAKENSFLIIDGCENQYILDIAKGYFDSDNILTCPSDTPLGEFLGGYQHGFVVGDTLAVQVDSVFQGELCAVVGKADTKQRLRPETDCFVIDAQQKAQTAVEVLQRIITLNDSGLEPTIFVSAKKL